MKNYFLDASELAVNITCPICGNEINSVIKRLPKPLLDGDTYAASLNSIDKQIECKHCKQVYNIDVFASNLGGEVKVSKDNGEEIDSYELWEVFPKEQNHKNQGSTLYRFAPTWDDLMDFGLTSFLDKEYHVVKEIYEEIVLFVRQRERQCPIVEQDLRVKWLRQDDYKRGVENKFNAAYWEKPMYYGAKAYYQNLRHKVYDGCLRSFAIKNYKNIDSLTLDSLKPINLFVGQNNVGKSNILEAMSLYVAKGSLKRIYEILCYRGENVIAFKQNDNNEINEEVNALLPIFPSRNLSLFNKKKSNTMILGPEGNALQIGIALAECASKDWVITPIRLADTTNLTRNHHWLYFARYTGSLNDTLNRPIVFNDDRQCVVREPLDGVGISVREKLMENVDGAYRFVNCKQLGTNSAEKLWSSFVMTEKEEHVLEALQFLSPSVVQFAFIREGNCYMPYVRMKNKQRMPLAAMGDGMIHVLNIILSMMACSGGMLFLDEIECGLHYSSLYHLWELIVRLSRIYRVQVFATTHSLDCIKAFAMQGNDTQCQVTRIEMVRNKLQAATYRSLDDVMDSIKYDVEIR